MLHELDTLKPAEAALLISAPLARIGVDATDVADTIAWRCGYQPLLVLRFGRVLLRQLADLSDHRDRVQGRSIHVGPEEVSAVFADATMQSELRWVTWHNFQGNRRASVVYHALLLELAREPVGAALEAPSDRVYDRLCQLNGGQPWLAATPEESKLSISAFLEEFTQRKLTVREPGPGERIRLRFPHHLPLLLTADLERKAADLVKLDRAESDGDRWGILPGTLADNFESRVSRSASQREVIVIATHWPEAITRSRAGVLGMAGIADSLVVPATELSTERLEKLQDAPCVVVTDVSGTGAAVLAERVRRRGLGGVFVGGVDLLREALREGRPVLPGGRVSYEATRWWLESARRLHFADLGAIPRLFNATAGVPMLLHLLDEVIQARPDAELEADAITAILDRFGARLDETLTLLRGPDPTFALTARERELVQMMALASPEVGLPVDALTDPVWSECFADRLAVPAITGADDSSVLALIHLGWLPAKAGPWTIAALTPEPLDRLVALSPGDPLFRLAEVLRG